MTGLTSEIINNNPKIEVTGSLDEKELRPKTVYPICPEIEGFLEELRNMTPEKRRELLLIKGPDLLATQATYLLTRVFYDKRMEYKVEEEKVKEEEEKVEEEDAWRQFRHDKREVVIFDAEEYLLILREYDEAYKRYKPYLNIQDPLKFDLLKRTFLLRLGCLKATKTKRALNFLNALNDLDVITHENDPQRQAIWTEWIRIISGVS